MQGFFSTLLYAEETTAGSGRECKSDMQMLFTSQTSRYKNPSQNDKTAFLKPFCAFVSAVNSVPQSLQYAYHGPQVV
jgi:hypothetical protein